MRTKRTTPDQILAAALGQAGLRRTQQTYLRLLLILWMALPGRARRSDRACSPAHLEMPGRVRSPRRDAPRWLQIWQQRYGPSRYCRRWNGDKPKQKAAPQERHLDDLYGAVLHNVTLPSVPRFLDMEPPADRTVPLNDQRIVTLREWQQHWQISYSLAQSWLHHGRLSGAYRSPDTDHGTWLLRLDVQPPAPIRRQPTPREQQQEN